MINSVSFIVIACNESFAIEKYLASIAFMQLTDCEVICVDSDSTDNTLDVMKSYIGKIQDYKIVLCTGYVNAAVARNAGLRYATKQYIFFVDGDVEIYPDFISGALDRMKSGNADAVIGQLSEIIYEPDYQNEIRRVGDRYHIREEKRVYFSGGIFIARSSIVQKTGSWDERMVLNEDIDFTLRLSRKGNLLAIPVIMGTHHTQAYHERPWQHVKKLYPVSLGMVIRKNIDRPYIMARMMKRYRGVLFGLIYAVLVCFFVCTLNSEVFDSLVFLVGLLGLFLFDISRGLIKGKKSFSLFIFHYIAPYMVIAGLFFNVNQRRSHTKVSRIA